MRRWKEFIFLVAVAVVGGLIVVWIGGFWSHPAQQSPGPAPSIRVSASASRSTIKSAVPLVLYSGKRDLSATYAVDLDNPHWPVEPVSSQPAGADIYFDGSGNLSRYGGQWGIVRGSQGGNGYQVCAHFTAFQPSLVPVSGFGSGTRLCVRTSAGRIGLLTVRNITGQDFNAIITFNVTIWNDP